MDKVATTASYASAGIVSIFGFSVNEFVALAGILLGIATWLTNLIYRHLHYKLEKGKSDADPKG
ncbi:HP1 family phage holin [uncultured Kiloniella sp.]|uniref:HP1 family phage holin n=1 Tax=uncultured Kiloniella sp. TaxID=1133091 RepID=UPI002623D1E0|nr:HP1 family phage holin [uncultured Kiloniella sp.]